MTDWAHAYEHLIGPPARGPHGRWLGAWLCPLHPDSDPSFLVDRDGVHHCFGCGAHGTIQDLARALGREPVQTPGLSPRGHREHRPRRRVPATLQSRMEEAVRRGLAHPSRLRAWATRGVAPETANRWELGLGRLPGGRHVRLLVPVVEGGRLRTIKARAWEDGDRGPKWLSVKGAPSALFGADHARATADGSQVLVVAEAPLDAILAMQARPDVLAVASAAGASADHGRLADLVRELAPRIAGVLVAYDNDLAGCPNPTAQVEGLLRLAERRDLEGLAAWAVEHAWATDLLDRYDQVRETHGWPRIPQPHGYRLAQRMARALAGTVVPVHTMAWPEDRPYGWDLADEVTANKIDR